MRFHISVHFWGSRPGYAQRACSGHVGFVSDWACKSCVGWHVLSVLQRAVLRWAFSYKNSSLLLQTVGPWPVTRYRSKDWLDWIVNRLCVPFECGSWGWGFLAHSSALHGILPQCSATPSQFERICLAADIANVYSVRCTCCCQGVDSASQPDSQHCSKTIKFNFEKKNPFFFRCIFDCIQKSHFLSRFPRYFCCSIWSQWHP